MRLLLTYVLPFHWMAAFLAMAMMIVGGPDGIGYLLGLMGAFAPGGTPLMSPVSMAVLATGFGLSSAIFLWMIVVVAIGPRDFPGPVEEVSNVAFGVAVAVVTMLFLFAAAHPIDGLFPAVALTTAALAASYAAIHAERRAASLFAVVEGEDIRAVARLMAAGAAHSSMLSRITGRQDAGERA